MFPKWSNLPALLTFVHTIATTATATTTTTTTDTDPVTPLTLTPRSHPASIPICLGPWPPATSPDIFLHPLLDAGIDLRIFVSLAAFCTAPRPANCACEFVETARRWEVHCDYNAVPVQHMWGFLYAIRYCERWCGCAGLPGLRMEGEEGAERGEAGGWRVEGLGRVGRGG